jgi:hypothetical protein
MAAAAVDCRRSRVSSAIVVRSPTWGQQSWTVRSQSLVKAIVSKKSRGSPCRDLRHLRIGATIARAHSIAACTGYSCRVFNEAPARDRKRAFFSVIAASVFNKSWVDRARPIFSQKTSGLFLPPKRPEPPAPHRVRDTAPRVSVPSRWHRDEKSASKRPWAGGLGSPPPPGRPTLRNGDMTRATMLPIRSSRNRHRGGVLGEMRVRAGAAAAIPTFPRTAHDTNRRLGEKSDGRRRSASAQTLVLEPLI